jgi:hypothetical protein
LFDFRLETGEMIDRLVEGCNSVVMIAADTVRRPNGHRPRWLAAALGVREWTAARQGATRREVNRARDLALKRDAERIAALYALCDDREINERHLLKKTARQRLGSKF